MIAAQTRRDKLQANAGGAALPRAAIWRANVQQMQLMHDVRCKRVEIILLLNAPIIVCG